MWLAVFLVALTPKPAHAGFLQTAVNANGQGYLTEDGQSWKGVGFNDYRVMNYPNKVCGSAMDMEDDFYEMDRIKDTGANVIRTWFFQQYYQDAPAGDKWHAFTHILQAAQNRGMKVIPVLTNQWRDCDKENLAPHHHSSFFYQWQYKERDSSGNAVRGYDYTAKEWAAMVAKQFNPDSGLASTIAFFQIANEAETDQSETESEPGTTVCQPGGRTILRAFADDMTTTIKDAYIDGVAGRNPPLVSLGTMGIGQCGVSTTDDKSDPNPDLDDTDFKYIHAGGVDLCEVHDYDAESTSSLSYNWYDIAGNNLGQRLTDCGAKPLVIGEAGIEANVQSGDLGRQYRTGRADADNLSRRANYLDAKMTAAFNNGVDAYLPWDKIINHSDGQWNLDNDNGLGYGAYGVGAAQDPAMCAVKAFTPAQNCTIAPMPPPPNPALHFDFEDGIEGWSTNHAWPLLPGGSPDPAGLSSGQTTYQAHTGTHALAITIHSNNYSAIENEGDSVGMLGPGDVVTMWVWSDSDTASVSFQPLLRINSGWTAVLDTAVNPANSTWTKLSVTVPSSATGGVHAVGLQVNDNDGLHNGKSVQLDDVEW